VVRLVEITSDNLKEVASLRVSATQSQYIDGVIDSLEEAAATPEAGPWPRAVYADETPVGFVMLSMADPPTDERYPFRYFLWRLLIDERFQGRGYGRKTIDAIVAELQTRWEADVLFTSAVPGEASPISFYEHYGFVRTGEIFDDEIVLRLDIERG
jgi:diamine N-acetyltransferase